MKCAPMKMSRFAVKAHQQGAKFVDPGKRAFTAKAQLVDFRAKLVRGQNRPRMCEQKYSKRFQPTSL